jgi:hypothetical protein
MVARTVQTLEQKLGGQGVIERDKGSSSKLRRDVDADVKNHAAT